MSDTDTPELITETTPPIIEAEVAPELITETAEAEVVAPETAGLITETAEVAPDAPEAPVLVTDAPLPEAIKVPPSIMQVAPAPAAPAQKRPHIVIATPCYGGAMFQNYVLSLINLIYFVQGRGDIDLSFIIRGGDSLITRSRNSITAEFLANDSYTHLLWIDADIGFEPAAVYRLLLSGYPIAAGAYPLKAHAWPEKLPAEMTQDEFLGRYTKFPFNPIGPSFRVDNGFVEVKDAPTGLMMIQRSVFDTMIKAYPQLKYKPDHQMGLENIANKINDFYYNFWDTFVDKEGRYLSEDYAFCRLWQEIGGKVFIDAESRLSHQGGYLFRGDFAKMLHFNYTKTAD